MGVGGGVIHVVYLPVYPPAYLSVSDRKGSEKRFSHYTRTRDSALCVFWPCLPSWTFVETVSCIKASPSSLKPIASRLTPHQLITHFSPFYSVFLEFLQSPLTFLPNYPNPSPNFTSESIIFLPINPKILSLSPRPHNATTSLKFPRCFLLLFLVILCVESVHERWRVRWWRYGGRQ